MFKNTKPIWMGIVNLSPNSFSDPHSGRSLDEIKLKCLDYIRCGAHIIDFGGVSTNPNIKNIEISAEEELKRVYLPIQEMRKILPKDILISIDTFSPKTAYVLAKEKMIDIINDIYAAQKKVEIDHVKMTTAHVAAKFDLGLILMHMFSKNETRPHSINCVDLIQSFLQERLIYCRNLGVKHLAIDPGIGYGHFGKTREDILELLKKDAIEKLQHLKTPLLYGVSRKAFQLDLNPSLRDPLTRDKLSKEIELTCIQYGVQIIRTHKI